MPIRIIFKMFGLVGYWKILLFVLIFLASHDNNFEAKKHFFNKLKKKIFYQIDEDH